MQNARFALSAHMVHLASPTDFSGWRDAARRLALAEVPPDEVAWEIFEPEVTLGPDHISTTPSPSRAEALDTSPPVPEGEEGSQAGRLSSTLLKGRGVEPTARRRGGLEPLDNFGSSVADRLPAIPPGVILKVPREFVDRTQTVICHSDPDRFAFLYRMLWRLRGEPNLLKIASDVDVRRFETMEKAIRRDIHKMRAFVRFRKIDPGANEEYVAWFEPDHFIVERNADFFVRRFTGMRWTILTPYASASWDTETLTIGPGAAREDAPAEDATEELWRTYFRNIFNPARLKVKAMQAEMPKKYWKNLPEADLIPDLIANADGAAREMIAKMPTTPAPHHAKIQAKHWPASETPSELDDGADAQTIDEARDAARSCRRCPLWRDATQTVFGEGPDDARVVFVGEQPGDQEDLAGKPFVGPAGKVFDAILEEAEVDRTKVYVTNAVKHFKFEPRGKRRIHAKPNAGEVQACRWWIDKELSLIKPNLVVALGATAALSLLGKAVAITKMRGQVIDRADGLRVFLTVHPSFILRIPDPADKEAERARFRDDMRAVKKLMAA